MFQNLSTYNNLGFNRQKSLLVECFWRLISVLVFESGLVPFYGVKRKILKCFGAKVGHAVVIKPGVKITFPWKLSIGDYSWIGEKVWIDSLEQVDIGSHVVVSQGSYLCTGNHDYKRPSFDLMSKPIVIKSESWLGAFCLVCPGVTVGQGAVLTMGSVASEDLDKGGVYQGNPAVKTRDRIEHHH